MWLSHVSVYVSSSRASAGSACPRSCSDRRRLALQLGRGASNQPSGWEDKGAAGCARRCHVTWRKLESASLVEKSPRKKADWLPLRHMLLHASQYVHRSLLRSLPWTCVGSAHVSTIPSPGPFLEAHQRNIRDNVLCLTS
ncbi:hypothetical protein CKAH01_17962 [Colletotrichum kahawae]|uniref:Uncharacterized protein n=1 Tax=Colletotrichum kahawae TaxID=34407 RepID=A0AAD9YA55_COLKA|nr:hypothetical protein CKAH01_17962 [Colletotrichum kahawae]